MQAEKVTVKTLMDIHQDMIEELQHYDKENGLELEDYHRLIKSVISIEVIMRELLREEEYIIWKCLYGIDRTY